MVPEKSDAAFPDFSCFSRYIVRQAQIWRM
jgi:hypothetical protein